MTLIHRIADALHFGNKTAPTDEQTGLNVHRQLDRLADSRAIVEYDLAVELRLAERLEAASKQAAAGGADGTALSDRREAVLVRISELRSAHRALTDAITQRAGAGNRLLNQQLDIDAPEFPTGVGTSVDDAAEDSEQLAEQGIHVAMDG